jgi:hypothetical protein
VRSQGGPRYRRGYFENRGMSAATMDHFEKDKPRKPTAVAGGRYPMVHIDYNVLSKEFLVDYLARGVVHAHGIREELNASRLFISVTNLPPARTVWIGTNVQMPSLMPPLRRSRRASCLLMSQALIEKVQPLGRLRGIDPRLHRHAR